MERGGETLFFESFESFCLAKATVVSELAFWLFGLVGRSLFLPWFIVPFLSFPWFKVLFLSFASSPLFILAGQKLDMVLARASLGISSTGSSSSGSSTAALFDENHNVPERDGGGRLFEVLASTPSVRIEWTDSLSLSFVSATVSFLRLNQKLEPPLVTLMVSFVSWSMFPARS